MPDESKPDDDRPTLEADLREAIQHRRAAQEQAEQTRAELALLMERARSIIARKEDGRTGSRQSDAEAGGEGDGHGGT